MKTNRASKRLLGLIAAFVALGVSTVDVAPRGAEFTVGFGPAAAHADVLDDISNALRDIASLGEKIAEYTTGPLATAIDAFRRGAGPVLDFVLDLAALTPNPVTKLTVRLIRDLLNGTGSIVDRLKRFGEGLWDDIKAKVELVKKTIEEKIYTPQVKELLTDFTGFLKREVFGKALDGLGAMLLQRVDRIAAKVAQSILGRTQGFRDQIDFMTKGLAAVAAEDTSQMNGMLATYNTSVETMGKDAVNMVIDLAFDWVREQVMSFVMKTIHKLLKPAWDLVYRAVAAGRNAAQTLVGSVPFAGGVLAATVGTIIDQIWNILKGRAEDRIQSEVASVVDMGLGKAKELLASTGAGNAAGGFLQGLIDAVRGPLQQIAAKVKTVIEPMQAMYLKLGNAMKTLSETGIRGSAGPGPSMESLALQAAPAAVATAAPGPTTPATTPMVTPPTPTTPAPATSSSVVATATSPAATAAAPAPVTAPGTTAPMVVASAPAPSAAAAATPTAAGGASLIKNGSFEDGNFSPVQEDQWVDVETNETKITGWAVTGKLNWVNPNGFSPLKDGGRVIDLSHAGHCHGGGVGVISQSVTTTPGARYKLVFNLAAPSNAGDACSNRKSGATSRTALVKVAGQPTTATVNNSPHKALVWEKKELSFTATSASTLISFEGADDDIGYWGVVLDAVSVVQEARATSPAPVTTLATTATPAVASATTPAPTPTATTPGATAGASLLKNGSFEDGNFTPVQDGQYVLVETGSPKISGWTVTGRLNWINETLFAPRKDGSRLIDLAHAGHCYGGGAGVISQSVTTTPGARYKLVFSLGAPVNAGDRCSNRKSGATSRTALVKVAGQPTSFTVNNSPHKALVWEQKTLSFTASSASTLISFEGADDDIGYWGVVLDAVSVVQEAPPAVPAAFKNASFEDGDFTPVQDGQYVLVETGSPKLSSWTVTGRLNWINATLFAPLKDGSRLIDLAHAGHCYGGGAGVISQSVTTTPGARYKLVFNLGAPVNAGDRCSNRKSGATSRTALVKVAGQATSFTVNNSPHKALVWERKELPFTASSASTVISFEGGDADIGYWGVVLDAVSIENAP